MFSQKIFSKRFSALRRGAKLSQCQMAKILGITQAAISKIETGERAASIEVLCDLADYFNVPMDYLTGRGLYQNWDEIMQYKDTILQVLESQNQAFAQLQIHNFTEQQLIHFLPAVLARVEIKDNTVKIAPLILSDEDSPMQITITSKNETEYENAVKS